MSCLVLHLFAYIYYFFSLFSPVDPETAAKASVTDYVIDGPSFSSEQLGKQTPLEHSDIAHSLLSYACIRTTTAFCMILL